MTMKITFITVLLVVVSMSVFPSLLYAQPAQTQANGITIAYESFGSKDRETILLISGTNAQLTMWPVEFCKGAIGYKSPSAVVWV